MAVLKPSLRTVQFILPPHGLFSEQVTALEVPYENRDVSLVILLPARVDGLTSLEKHVTASKLLHCIARLEERPLVTVCLPLLRLRHVTELSSVLKAMGLGLLFTDRANLRLAAAGVVSKRAQEAQGH
ncbi:hypothetical protein HPB48_016982 [Haemaphysalis longicornis]|uniref:Serpin domain-containing protein n=1 Tax=Haemaphysalis longicornis TaxID=44386 RepID=A0A9J6GJ26_HAELO|nr:hypothetical protein HPB48_016982 [Haemaphysalis longicornis]